MARQHDTETEILVETESFDLPSGRPVTIREITGAAQKVFSRKDDLMSGKWINKYLYHAVTMLDGNPIPTNYGEANVLFLDMLSGDRNYLLTKVRMFNFGTAMDFNFECPDCHKTSGYHVDLQEAIDSKELKMYPYREDMPLVVEFRGGNVEIEYPTGRTEEWLYSHNDNMDVIFSTMPFCKTFNGRPPKYSDFENLYARDLNKIRNAIEDLKGGFDERLELKCLHCQRINSAPLHLIPEFFFPRTMREYVGI